MEQESRYSDLYSISSTEYANLSKAQPDQGPAWLNVSDKLPFFIGDQGRVLGSLLHEVLPETLPLLLLHPLLVDLSCPLGDLHEHAMNHKCLY